ncbi:MAG: hypothetical protein WD875_17895 [Pirellulales bacterium]
MDSDQRSGTPVLRPKLDRPQGNGPTLGELIKMSAAAAAMVAALGIVVAAAVPSIDLFGIYAQRDSTAAAQPAAGNASPTPRAPATSNAPPAPEPAPLADSHRSPAPTLPDDAEASPLDPTPVDPAPTTDDTQTPPVESQPMPKSTERSVERDMALLRDLKPAVALPPVADVGDATLAYLHEAERIRFDDVQLLAGLAAIDDGQTFQLERDGKKPQWTIRFTAAVTALAAAPAVDASADADAGDGSNGEGEGSDVTGGAGAGSAAVDLVLADVWCVESSVMFRWHAEAKDVPAAEQLRNAALRFSVSSQHRVMALREPVVHPAHTLDLSDRSSEITAAIANPPRAESLYLEVLGTRDMPVNAYFEHEKQVIPLAAGDATKADDKPQRPVRPKPSLRKPDEKPGGDDSPERIGILFDEFVDGERPQLWIDGKYDGADEVTVRIAARIVRGKIVDDLTTKSLELYRLPRERRQATVERDWKNAHDAMVFIDRRIGETRAGINPSASVGTLQTQYKAAERAYKKLDDELNRIKAELAWVDAAKLLIGSLDKHGQLKYRVFAKSGDLQIDLVRGGLD